MASSNGPRLDGEASVVMRRLLKIAVIAELYSNCTLARVGRLVNERSLIIMSRGKSLANIFDFIGLSKIACGS